MKRILAVLSFISCLAASGQLFAVGYNVYSALIYVYDQDGNPLAGIPVSLFVQTWYGIDQEYTCLQNGTTGGNGSAYLECWIPEMYSMGLDYMVANMTNLSYTIISSQNTFTSTASAIYPVFDIGLDSNENGVVDAWEMPLAQKFCPVLFAPLEDRGFQFGGNFLVTLRPVPVEVFDIDGPSGVPDGKLTYHDVYVEVEIPDPGAGSWIPVGEWEMEEIFVNGVPYSSLYPHQVEPNHVPTGTVQAPGLPPSQVYLLHPHYEWASHYTPEDNYIWYELWEQIFNSNPQNSLIRDGCVYVSFLKNTNDFTIEYRLHYPFNAWTGRHEGDWSNLQVTVTSQDPTIAQIASVSYPFHELRTVRTQLLPFLLQDAESYSQNIYYEEGETHPAGDKFFAFLTHPVSFSGGRGEEYGVEGWGSHGQYPLIGTWIRQPSVFPVDVEEYVVENGSILAETVIFDFNNYQNIIIIPPKSYVLENLINDPDYNWLVFGGYWGHRRSYPSAAPGGYVPPATNTAPHSPYGGVLN